MGTYAKQTEAVFVDVPLLDATPAGTFDSLL
jgi:hypothetical protein